MSQTEKAAYFRELKDAGVPFSKHYREYTTEELKEAVDLLRSQQPQHPRDDDNGDHSTRPPEDHMPQQRQDFDGGEVDEAAAAFFGLQIPENTPRQNERAADELPGMRQNTKDDLEPIRVDDNGRIWYQEEIRKPGSPAPRARRVLKYVETGTEVKTVQTLDETGKQYIESFEVSGQGPAREQEVKITLPSYQTGIFRDPRFPFKVHVYNEVQGFDLFDVQDYYGGPELVPAEVKRFYVANDLCYDIRTTVRAIESEYRQLQLQNRV